MDKREHRPTCEDERKRDTKNNDIPKTTVLCPGNCRRGWGLHIKPARAKVEWTEEWDDKYVNKYVSSLKEREP